MPESTNAITTHDCRHSHARIAASLGLLFLGIAPGCGSGGGNTATPGGATGSAEAAPWFEDVAAASGLDYQHDSTLTDRYLMPENVPGGAALLDMDGDGDLDVYFVQSGDVLAAGRQPFPKDFVPSNETVEFVYDTLKAIQ